MNCVSKDILLFLLFLLLLLMKFFHFLLFGLPESSHMTIYKLLSVSTINTCMESFILFEWFVELVKRNERSFFLCDLWFVVFLNVIHKFLFGLEEWNQGLSKIICCSFPKFCLVWLQRFLLRILFLKFMSILIFKNFCVLVNKLLNSDLSEYTCKLNWIIRHWEFFEWIWGK